MIRIKLFVLDQPEYFNISWFKVEEFIVINNQCYTTNKSICVKTNDYYLVFDIYINNVKELNANSHY